MYRWEFTSKSRKELLKLDKQIQFKIIDKLDYYCSCPTPLMFAEPITDTELGSYRFRIGSYRVIFDVKEETLVIHKVGHRKDIYR